MSFDEARLKGGDLTELKGFEKGTFLLDSSNEDGIEWGRVCKPVKDRLRGRVGRAPLDVLELDGWLETIGF
jgi:hypothetical protein